MPPASSQEAGTATRKRKETSCTTQPAKRSRSQPTPCTAAKPALIAPHEAIIAQLRPKYNVLAASVISSTQIQKRVKQAISHLGTTSDLPNVVLLHARTAEVCKLITIVELCKRSLGEEGNTWFQYNELFELPEREKKDLVEETVLERKGGENDSGEDDDDDDDDFEVMASRFERAVMPEPSKQVAMSMRVFLSMKEVEILKSRKGITVQSSPGA
ncbi:hypothetical protein ED733_001515 [Metarhizium rileyi]|uniref:DNA/RNA-binding protein Alba-like domain-containing protein n=1 Tax=Metarhizium rileyi (strain RCEF 4871) TaxID=1649241 RepID=A0A5C6G3M9_METRR|nr:hypothetical protein ED733_001515 [Metarhizium rileyi]